MGGRDDPVEWAAAQARDFAKAFGHSDEPAWVLEDGSRRFVDANAAACALVGYSREQLLRLDDLATPELRDQVPSLSRRSWQPGVITACMRSSR